jgi:hypothetical protein
MKTWFTSLNAGIALSVIALLAVLARITFLDALFVLEFRKGFSEDRPGQIVLSMLGYMILFGSWIWALLAATRGGRAGMVVALLFSLLLAFVGGLFTLLVLCPVGCAAWPAGNLIVWIALITGLAASVALMLQLWSNRQPIDI